MMNLSLPVAWQYVFPSPVYPSLQEHLNEPSVFEHDARLWKQSSDPCTHSSTSKNDKENRLFPAKILGKSDAMRRKKRTKTRQSKKSYETCLFVLIACLLVLSWCTIMILWWANWWQVYKWRETAQRKKEKRNNLFYWNGFDKIWRKNPPGL